MEEHNFLMLDIYNFEYEWRELRQEYVSSKVSVTVINEKYGEVNVYFVFSNNILPTFAT